jgi:putative CocE/NonD family hydrolase
MSGTRAARSAARVVVAVALFGMPVVCGFGAVLGTGVAARLGTGAASAASSAAPAPLAAVSPASPPTTVARSAITGAPLPGSGEVAALRNVMVTMRDGTRLATDVYLPARDGVALPGRFPVILSRTPYNKDGAAVSTVPMFVPYGYAVVLQDVRGRFRSEGRWVPLKDDPQDGADTAKWVCSQPWSSKAIGTIGSSYPGATQHALAIGGAPCVKAMVPRNAMSNFGRYGVRHHGAFELRWLNWVVTLGNAAGTPDMNAAALRAAVTPSAAPALVDFGERVQDYARALPIRAGTTPLALAPDYEAWFLEAISHGRYDAFWKDHGSDVLAHLAEYADVPEYHTTGWYDSWGTSVANMNFVELTRTKKSLQRLIVGPWIHSSEHLDYAGEAQFTPDAALDLGAFQRRWFDRWLKGIDNGVDREPPVRIYVMGGGDAHRTPEGRIFVGGRWRDEREWPLARTRYTPYYLHANGTLDTTPPTSEPPVSYEFDPRNPVPTLGGNVSSQGKLMFQGAADQRGKPGFWLTPDTKPLAARNDVLVFRTAPLTEDVEVTGRIRLTLWASSDGRDTDFTVKLVDVYPPNKDFPNGVELNVADGIVRARYRDDLDREQWLTPGKPVEFTIETYPTSLVFAKGHRIRVDVSSSNFPRFDVNPNTGEPLNDNRRWRVATNTVYFDAQKPSRIVLPIIPSN